MRANRGRVFETRLKRKPCSSRERKLKPQGRALWVWRYSRKRMKTLLREDQGWFPHPCMAEVPGDGPVTSHHGAASKTEPVPPVTPSTSAALAGAHRKDALEHHIETKFIFVFKAMLLND